MMTAHRSHSLRAVATAAWLVIVGGATAGGCGGLKYPACDNDQDCNGDGHKGVCISHTCVECRDNTNCATGQQCQSGACTDVPGFCDATHACPAGQSCGQDARCHAAQKVADAPFVECDETKVCGTGTHCENGHCVAPPQGGPGCTDFPSPKFDYEAQDLKGDARSTLERLAQCLTKGTLKGSKVLLTGHCDARGEQEFNMSLGDYRAEAVKTFLVSLGVSTNDVRTSSRGELDASGTDEAGWATDRRVDIEVR
jgi:outer membrane protein OmpA-like peptidoglycan-associated protein